MKIHFVTKNLHKINEAKEILKEFNIDVEQIAEDKYEPKELSLKDVAEYNAKFFYEKYKKPVIVDDTGVFFKAYKDFPGSHPKLMFDLLGYKGLLKLLEGENRDAQFRTCVGYCDENGVRIFDGILKGKIDTKINNADEDFLPYERIFLINGRPMSNLSRDEKNKISHRADSLKKLGQFLTQKKI